MNTSHTSSSEDSLKQEDVIAMVNSILDGGQPGVLSTLDFHGAPQSRWMATSSFEGFPCFYTLTSTDSPKVEQIEAHPQVHWMFSSPDLKLVVNLTGRACVLPPDPAILKKIWHQIADKSRAYFLGDSVHGPGFSIIETTVEVVECTLPELGRKLFLDPHRIHPERHTAAPGC
ncbi:MAG: pyridoxamine 5'-phosphate oxidase family protein [Verrucomicrobiota bacterium]